MDAGVTWLTVGARALAPEGRRQLTAIVTLAVAVLAAACGAATEPAPSTFSATLSGVREAPPNTTTASGVAMIAIAGSRLTYTVSASGFATPLVLGDILVGAPGGTGPIVVPFTIAAQSGTVAHGQVDLSQALTYNTLTLSGDSLRTLMNAGLTYVNLFTVGYPGGEIRGQILRQ